jgi:hypothetical protein
VSSRLPTANQVVQQLGEPGRELDAAIRTLKDAEFDAVTKRHIADLAESQAFVSAEGTAELIGDGKSDSVAIEVEFIYDPERENWAYRVPTLHITGGAETEEEGIHHGP